MNASTITKTLNKIEKQPKNYSLGFKRIHCLPKRIRLKLNLACIKKGESNDNSAKEFLNGLTDAEFINWMKLA